MVQGQVPPGPSPGTQPSKTAQTREPVTGSSRCHLKEHKLSLQSGKITGYQAVGGCSGELSAQAQAAFSREAFLCASPGLRASFRGVMPLCWDTGATQGGGAGDTVGSSQPADSSGGQGMGEERALPGAVSAFIPNPKASCQK